MSSTDLDAILKWAEDREEKKRKKSISSKYIVIAIIALFIIVIVWILINSSFKSDQVIYTDIDTGEDIDIEACKKQGYQVIFEDEL